MNKQTMGNIEHIMSYHDFGTSSFKPHGHDKLQEIYNESVPFKQYLRSLIQMLFSPRKTMRMLNFAFRISAVYKIDVE